MNKKQRDAHQKKLDTILEHMNMLGRLDTFEIRSIRSLNEDSVCPLPSDEMMTPIWPIPELDVDETSCVCSGKKHRSKGPQGPQGPKNYDDAEAEDDEDEEEEEDEEEDEEPGF